MDWPGTTAPEQRDDQYDPQPGCCESSNKFGTKRKILLYISSKVAKEQALFFTDHFK
jgi:hypothetical protein